jgi:short-subunit dehydrogenase
MTNAQTAFDTLIITGGSSGIGLGILRSFAVRYPSARCINISRSAPPEDTVKNLTQIHADLSQRAAIATAVQRIEEELDKSGQDGQDGQDGRILLVNNSGIGLHSTFQSAQPADTLKTIDLNIAATVGLTHALLPLLLERGGHIVVVSSTSAFQPTAEMATYGASKAFLLNWTLALGEDLRGTSVRTLVLCPGGTETPFLAKAGFKNGLRTYWPLLSVRQVTDALFRGLDKNRSLVVPGWINTIIAGIAKTAPLAWSTPVAAHIMRHAKI